MKGVTDTSGTLTPPTHIVCWWQWFWPEYFLPLSKKHCFHNPLLQGQLSHFLQYWKLIRRCCFDGQIWMIAEKQIWAFCQRFLKETMNIIDMVAICPFYISLILEGLEDFEIIGKTGKMIRLVSGATSSQVWFWSKSFMIDARQSVIWYMTEASLTITVTFLLAWNLENLHLLFDIRYYETWCTALPMLSDFATWLFQ